MSGTKIHNMEIPSIHEELRLHAQKKMDIKTKPPGALGVLEEIAVRMSLIQNTLNPIAGKKALIVFAGDHGVAAEGVSAFPSEVTQQMVKNFLAGGAAINVLCRHNSVNIHIVDMGVNGNFEDCPDLIDKKVRKGTRSFLREDAMTREEAFQALQNGADVFMDIYDKSGPDVLGLGEMGIGNTASAAAIISAVTGISVEEATGRGTGVDDDGLARKIQVIKQSLELHKPDPEDGMDILIKVGGYEIAGIAGAALAAASKGTAVVIDGVISTAGALIASLLMPEVKSYLVAGHKSVEPAHQAALDHLNLRPVLDLDMRLGEGTGAALTMNIVDAACKIMREMASFEEAGVFNQLP